MSCSSVNIKMSLDNFLPNGEARVLWNRFESLVGQQVFRLRVEGEAANIPSSLCYLLSSNLSSPERMDNFDPNCIQSGHLQRNTNALEIDKQPLYGLPYIAQSMCPLLSLVLLTMQELRSLDRNVDPPEADRRIKSIKQSLIDVHKKALLLESQLHQYINPTLVTTLNRRSAKATFEAELMGKLIDKLRKDSRQSATLPEKRKRVCELTMKLKALLCRQKCEWQCVGRLKETLAMAKDMKGVLKFICQLSCLLQHCSDASRRLTDRPPPYEYCSSFDSSSKQDSSDALYEDLKSTSIRCQPCPSQSSQSEVTISLSLDFTSDREFCDRSYESDNTTGTRNSSPNSGRRSTGRSIDSDTNSSVHDKSHRSSSVPSTIESLHSTRDMSKTASSRDSRYGNYRINSKERSQSKVLAEETINELIEVLEDYIENRSENEMDSRSKSSPFEMAFKSGDDSSSEFASRQKSSVYSSMQSDPHSSRSPSKMSSKRSGHQSLSYMPNNLIDSETINRPTHSSLNYQGNVIKAAMSRKFLEGKGLSEQCIHEIMCKWNPSLAKMSTQYLDNTPLIRTGLNENEVSQQRFNDSKMSNRSLGYARMSGQYPDETKMSMQGLDETRMSKSGPDETKMSKQSIGDTGVSKQSLGDTGLSEQNHETKMSKQSIGDTGASKQSLDETTMSKQSQETKMSKQSLDDARMSRQSTDETRMSKENLSESPQSCGDSRMSRQYHDESKMSKHDIDESRISMESLNDSPQSCDGSQLHETKSSKILHKKAFSPHGFNEMKKSEETDEIEQSKQSLNETRRSRKSLSESRLSPERMSETRESKQNVYVIRTSEQPLDETRRILQILDETRLSKQSFDETRMSKKSLNESRLSPKRSKQSIDESKMSKQDFDDTRMSKKSINESRLSPRKSKQSTDDTRMSKQSIDESRKSKQDFDNTRMSKQDFDDTRMSKQDFDDTRMSKQDFDDTRMSKQSINESRMSKQDFDDTRISRKSLNESRLSPKRSKQDLDDPRMSKQDFDETRMSRKNLNEGQLSPRRRKQDLDETRMSKQDFDETRMNKKSLNESRLSPRRSKQDLDETRMSKQNFDETRISEQDSHDTRMSKQYPDEDRLSTQSLGGKKIRRSFYESQISPEHFDIIRRCKQVLDETRMSRTGPMESILSPQSSNDSQLSKQSHDDTRIGRKNLKEIGLYGEKINETQPSPQGFSSTRMGIPNLDHSGICKHILNAIKNDFSPSRICGEDYSSTRICKQCPCGGRMSAEDLNKQRMVEKILKQTQIRQKDLDDLIHKQCLDQIRRGKRNCNETGMSEKPSDEIIVNTDCTGKTKGSQDNIEATTIKQIDLKKQLAIECANIVRNRIASFSSSENKQTKISKEILTSTSPPRAKREDIDKAYSSYEISKISQHESDSSKSLEGIAPTVRKLSQIMSINLSDIAESKDYPSSSNTQLKEHESESKDLDDTSANKSMSDSKVSNRYSKNQKIANTLDTCTNRRTTSLMSKKSESNKYYMQPRYNSSDSSGSREPLLFSSIDLTFDDEPSVFHYKKPKHGKRKQSKELRHKSHHRRNETCFSGNESELLEDTTTTSDSCTKEMTFSHKSSFKSGSSRHKQSSRTHSVDDTEGDIDKEVDFEEELDAEQFVDSRSDDQPSLESDCQSSLHKLRSKSHMSKRSLSQPSHRKSKSRQNKRSVSQSSGKTSSVIEYLQRSDAGSRMDALNTSPMRPSSYTPYESRTSLMRRCMNEQSSDLSSCARHFTACEGFLPTCKHDSISANIISGMKQSQYYETDLINTKSAKSLTSPVLSQKSGEYIAHRLSSGESKKSSIIPPSMHSALFHSPLMQEESNSIYRGFSAASRHSQVSVPSCCRFGQSPVPEEPSLTQSSILAQSLLHNVPTAGTLPITSVHGDTLGQSQVSEPASDKFEHTIVQEETSLGHFSLPADSTVHNVPTASTLPIPSVHEETLEKLRQSQVSVYSDGKRSQSPVQIEPLMTYSSILAQSLLHNVQSASTLPIKSMHGDTIATLESQVSVPSTGRLGQSPVQVEELFSRLSSVLEQSLLRDTLTASALSAGSVKGGLSATSWKPSIQRESMFTQTTPSLTQSVPHTVPTLPSSIKLLESPKASQQSVLSHEILDHTSFRPVSSTLTTPALSVHADPSVTSRHSQILPESPGTIKEPSLQRQSPTLTHMTSVHGDPSVTLRHSQTLPDSPGTIKEPSLQRQSPTLTHMTSVHGDPSVTSRHSQTLPDSPGTVKEPSLRRQSPTLTHMTSVHGDPSVTSRHSQTSDSPGTIKEPSLQRQSPTLTHMTSVHGDPSVTSRHSQTLPDSPGTVKEPSLRRQSPTLTHMTSVHGDPSVTSRHSQTLPDSPGTVKEPSLRRQSPTLTHMTSVHGDPSVTSRHSQTLPDSPGTIKEPSLQRQSPTLTHMTSVHGDPSVTSRHSQTLPDSPGTVKEPSLRRQSPTLTHMTSVHGDPSVTSRHSQTSDSPGSTKEPLQRLSPTLTHMTSVHGDPSVTSRHSQLPESSGTIKEDSIHSESPTIPYVTSSVHRDSSVTSRQSQIIPKYLEVIKEAYQEHSPNLSNVASSLHRDPSVTSRTLERPLLTRGSSGFLTPTLVQEDPYGSLRQSQMLSQSLGILEKPPLTKRSSGFATPTSVQGDPYTSRKSMLPQSIEKIEENVLSAASSGYVTPTLVQEDPFASLQQLQSAMQIGPQAMEDEEDSSDLSKESRPIPIAADLSGASEYSYPSRQSPSKSLKQSITRKSFTPEETDVISASSRSSLRTSARGSLSTKLKVSLNPNKEVFEGYEDTEQVETLYTFPSSMSSLHVKDLEAFDPKGKWWIIVPMVILALLLMYYFICYVASIGGCVGCRAPLPNVFFSLMNSAAHSVRLVHFRPAPV